MTNKEYLLKYLSEHEDVLVEVINDCSFCHKIGITEYCRSTIDIVGCTDTIKSWLAMEHEEPLLFPIGTLVEVHTSDTWVGYYNGAYKDKHFVTRYKSSVGLKQCDDKTPYGLSYLSDTLRKVGEVND